MKKYELTQYEFVKVRVDHKPLKSRLLQNNAMQCILETAILKEGGKESPSELPLPPKGSLKILS